jgi:hypothetical protein
MTGSQINSLFTALFGLMPLSLLGNSSVIHDLAIGLLAFYWRNTHGL